MQVEFYRVMILLRELIKRGIMAPLYRLPVSIN
jgi:hypothetical protein